jgi:hypothetical protein
MQEQSFNFADARKRAEESGALGGGNYLKVKEGQNVFRLVSPCLEHRGSFNGKPTFKWFCFVLDRADGLVKQYFMPHTVYEQIAALQVTPGYEFASVPMPYDLILNVKGAGTKEVVYTVIAARQSTPLTPDEQKAVQEAGDVRVVQKEVFAAAAEKTGVPVNQTQAGPRHEGGIDITVDDLPPFMKQ